jgi:acyl-CoA hydrolase
MTDGIHLESPAALAQFVAEQLSPGAELVVPIANGEPVHLLGELEAFAEDLRDVRVHQMHALRDHAYLHGAYRGRLEHVSWFLSPVTRPAYAARGCELVPANFSEMPQRLLEREPAFVLAAGSPPDAHGWFSLGVNADYVVPLIGRVPFVIEANTRMPRTFGTNLVHLHDVAAWTVVDEPVLPVNHPAPKERDLRIGELVAERIPDGATLQIGSGIAPRATVAALRNHRQLGIHTELFSNELMDLVEWGVATGARKTRNRHRAVTTFALGGHRLYEWLHENRSVEFRGVNEVNDPRQVALEDSFCSVNGAIQVDLFGQCASETIGTTYYTGSGGQADFARGTMFSPHGKGFIVLHASADDGRISRIAPTLDNGSIVTTTKNTVDMVVTEHGVAEMRGRSFDERARALIAIAAPEHREWLERAATDLSLLHGS